MKALLVIAMLLLPGLSHAIELGAARISLIRGDVQVQTEETGDFVAASINMPLKEGDRLWSPEGARAEIQIQGGVYLRIGPSTSLDILALHEDSSQFFLNGGQAYINNRQGGIDHIQVDTPRASVGCYDNSLILIDAYERDETEVSVIKGYAVAENPQGRTRIEAGYTLNLSESATADISPLAPPDEWETWNRDRDRRLASGSRSLRYLPEELDDYAYDFDDNGRWVYVTNYGYAWTPFNVSVNWSPYREGRWSWVGSDYVWISYDPWGWVPHHYGRWTFVANFGWCWVPPPRGGVYWSPGYVGWVNTPTYVAWVPLAPGEIYYGRGYYGPRSIDIRSLGTTRIDTRNFRNSNIRNAVTVVNREGFVSGRRQPARFRGNPFRTPGAVVGPPAITPTRAAAVPVIRSIPQSRRPPERVRNLSVQELRRERAVTRGAPGTSVFHSGPAPSLPVTRQPEPRGSLRTRQVTPSTPTTTRPEQPSRRSTVAPRERRQPPSSGTRQAPLRRGEPRWQEPVPAPGTAVPAPASRAPALRSPGSRAPAPAAAPPASQKQAPTVTPRSEGTPPGHAPSQAPPGRERSSTRGDSSVGEGRR